VIPLDKIQDIELVSDWCGDTCGYVKKAGDIYQLHFQTAGQGTEKAELSVFCIENPREFKKSVLDAKARVRTDTTITGQSKTLQVAQQPLDIESYQQQERLVRVLELLERQLAQKVPG
jgi:GTPase Era involved in 16S rRNA processing